MSGESRLDHLETLRIEYEAAEAEAVAQQRVYNNAIKARDTAAQELVTAIIDTDLTEYGPITSTMEWHEPSLSYRRKWRLG